MKWNYKSSLEVYLQGSKARIRVMFNSFQRHAHAGDQLSALIGKLFDLRVPYTIGPMAARDELLDRATILDYVELFEGKRREGAYLRLVCDVVYVDTPWLAPLELLAKELDLKLGWYFVDVLRDNCVKCDPKKCFPGKFAVVCDGDDRGMFATEQAARDYIACAKAMDAENMDPVNHAYKVFKIKKYKK